MSYFHTSQPTTAFHPKLGYIQFSLQKLQMLTLVHNDVDDTDTTDDASNENNYNRVIRIAQKCHALLESGAEVSLIYIQVFNSLKEKPKLKKQSAFLQLVKGDSNDIDGCASLKYEIGREKQENEFFVVLEMDRNIILGRDCLK